MFYHNIGNYLHESVLFDRYVEKSILKLENTNSSLKLIIWYNISNGSLGGVKMTEADETSLQQLALKVQQHEKTIAQLVEIIATTNGRISELVDTLKDPQYYSNNLHVSSPER